SLQAEERGRVVDVVEDVGRGLVDRGRPGAGGRVGLGAGMDGKRRKAGGAVVAHSSVSLVAGRFAPGSRMAVSVARFQAKGKPNRCRFARPPWNAVLRKAAEAGSVLLG